MIIEFSAKNFMSIKDIQTFSFLASKIEEKNNIISKINSLSILPVSVIYGANASGKTNILSIPNFIKIILNLSSTIQPGDKIPYKPFKLDYHFNNKPSEFQIVFLVNKVKYTYGFSHTDSKICEEYLYYYPKGRRAAIFERTNTTKFDFKNDKTELQTLSKRTLDNRLFLTVASEWKYEKCSIPFEWLKNNLIVNTSIDTPNWFEFSAKNVIQQTDIGHKISNFIKMADPSIISLSGTEEEFSVSDLPKEFPEEFRKIFQNSPGKKLNVFSSHRVVSKNGFSNINFDLNEESSGTRRFFELLGPLVDIIANGKSLILDELDVKLHTNLSLILVLLFQNKEINKNNAQLLFSTHDTNLLDLNIFRRDQIWFAEKTDSEMNTILYSLIELKNIRKDENTQKGYLFGKYGGLPIDLFKYLSEWN